ncbi:CubicO group peptidase, beta-lactamase class C family [Gracilibacillus ureilyticus]|uniref:CubicO group peptidase, beta-lactamase class C family n=1 Tax=Gracilibacillus ureilyticus TaxID=531814 RepID=A0A1H9U1H7_9BACI|nr:serine hydrolase domain-containing protein [Gracilibacillus ureilyticus]SES03325.1 CubicO group peptidase, beta-lactamase class C family [Gracilibacillus ureilyticus]
MRLSVKIFIIIVLSLLFNGLLPETAYAENEEKIRKIEQLIEDQRELSEIPGISVVIVQNGETMYQNGFGYADVETETPVNSQTLFELGSTTKAFTGLAILQLEKEGLIKRTDDVRTYLPWLELKYKEDPQKITIDQLLHHTSGIPSATIVHIPESNDEGALEKTVKTLIDQPLNRKPGSTFEYATINYDVLGLIIEKVSKQSYDKYIKEHILEPAGMSNSFVGLHQVNSAEMAAGYKIGFMNEKKYIPPIYRGNIPAGYIISNSNDIAEWMRLQLGSKGINEIDTRIFEESHVADQSVAPFDMDTYYAAGWSVMEKDDQRYLYHAGQNPTFSSYIIMKPDIELGIAVLSNMNSTNTTAIGQGVMDVWEGKDVDIDHTDQYQKLDQIVSIICIIVGALGAVFLLLSLRILQKIINKERCRTFNGMRLTLLIIHSLLAAALFTLMFLFPKILGMTWDFIKVWGPGSISAFLYVAIFTTFIFYIWGLMLIVTIGKGRRR